MECPSCAQENPDNARFCGSCQLQLGTTEEISSSTVTPNLTEREPGRKTRGLWRIIFPVLMWVWGGILILGGIIELTESNGGGVFILIGGAMTIYAGIVFFQTKTLFDRFTSGWSAITLSALGFLLFAIGISTQNSV